jgi:hypothetical protein
MRSKIPLHYWQKPVTAEYDTPVTVKSRCLFSDGDAIFLRNYKMLAPGLKKESRKCGFVKKRQTF